MELENRYIVFKKNRMSYDEMRMVDAIADALKGDVVVDCLVIEEDWPEYEPALKMLSARVDREALGDVEGEINDETETISLSKFLDEWNINNPINRQIVIKAWYEALSSVKCEHVATLLSSDPYEERDGFFVSLKDSQCLSALPAGTKLYVVKS